MGLFDFVGDALDSVGDAISSVRNSVGNFIGDNLRTIGRVAGGLAGLVIGGPPGLIASAGLSGLGAQQAVEIQIKNTVQAPVSVSVEVGDFLETLTADVINRVAFFADGLQRDLFEAIEDNVSDGINAFGALTRGIFQSALSKITNAITQTEALEQSVLFSLFKVIDAASFDIAGLGSQVGQALGDIADSVETGIISVLGDLGNAVSGILQDVVTVQEAVQEEARALIRAQTDAAVGVVGAVGDLAESAAAIAAQNRDALMAALETHVGTPLGALGERVWEAAVGRLTGVVDDDKGKLEDTVRNAGLGTLCGSDITGNLDDLANRFLPENPIIRWLFSLLVATFTWMSIFGGITSAQASVALQQYGENCPYKVLSPPDAILAQFRGQISMDEMLTTIQKDGFSRADAQSMWISSLQVPNELDLAGMLLREIITEPEFRDAMRHRGWDEGWTSRMQTASKLLPPVQDLISMAVREAFTPAAVQEFGLDQDFPEDFAFWAERQGVSRDWAEKYWSAHWALPSVQMGYEMLHRGIITQEQLVALMRALDIVPAWRDNLIQMSFANFTRVDIRRMNKLGVLSEAEVNRAYHDIGYDDDKAEKLTAFTLEVNKPRRTEDTKDLSALTRAQVLGFYSDGVIDRREAENLLRRGGFTDDVIDLLLESTDLDIEREERHADRDLIIELAKAGTISFDEAQDRLAGIGLETLEQTRALNTLVRAQAAATRLPSKADLAKFLLAEIIPEPAYLDGMRRLGYSEAWAGRYLTLVQGAAGSA